MARWVPLLAALSLVLSVALMARTWHAAKQDWVGSTYGGVACLLVGSLVADVTAWATRDASWLALDLLVLRPLAATILPGVTLIYWRGVKGGGSIADE
ncbi:MAG: hypothetical protein OEV62_00110 [Actinomycetota bacterium]|nr:hypothetical protein [Actinomycetota bacterium]